MQIGEGIIETRLAVCEAVCLLQLSSAERSLEIKCFVTEGILTTSNSRHFGSVGLRNGSSFSFRDIWYLMFYLG